MQRYVLAFASFSDAVTTVISSSVTQVIRVRVVARHCV